MSGLTVRTAAWRRNGEVIQIDGRSIFVRRQDGERSPGEPALLFLHGYPSSSYDWRAAFDRLQTQRLVAFDFLGYGLSEKPRDVLYSLSLQADLAEALVEQLLDGPVTLIAHDMGSSVATELLARDLDGRLSFPLASVLLFNASLVRERASLLLGQKLLLSRLGPLASRLTTRRGFVRQVSGIFSESHPLSDEEAADQWSLLSAGGGQRLLHRLIHYNRERVTPPFAGRWHRALRDWPGRLEIGWADRDPICTEAVLEAVLELRPSAPVTRLSGLGHYPQLEDPQRVYELIARHVAAPPA